MTLQHSILFRHGNDLPADMIWNNTLLLARLSIQGIAELVCMSQGIHLLRVFAVLVEAEDLSCLLPWFSELSALPKCERYQSICELV